MAKKKARVRLVDTTFRDNTVIMERVSYRSTSGLRVNGQVCRTTRTSVRFRCE